MASCHNCGAYIQSGQGFRREVHTGSSSGIRIGKTLSSSSRSYSAVRTLCSRCTATHDRQKQFGRLIPLAFFVGGVFWLSKLPSPQHKTSTPASSSSLSSSAVSPSVLANSSNNSPKRLERHERSDVPNLDSPSPTSKNESPLKSEQIEDGTPASNGTAFIAIPSLEKPLETKNMEGLIATNSSPIPETPLQVEQVKEAFQQHWQHPGEMSSTLQYHLMISSDGVLRGIAPIDTSSAKYLSQEMVALIGQSIASPSPNGQASQIRVVITQDGQVRTSLE